MKKPCPSWWPQLLHLQGQGTILYPIARAAILITDKIIHKKASAQILLSVPLAFLMLHGKAAHACF